VKVVKSKFNPDEALNPNEAPALLNQHQKDAALPSLLYVTRKLGEVERG